MKLLTKFNLLFVLVFGIGLAIVGSVAYRFLQEDARQLVVEQATLMLDTMSSARDYTATHVAPLLEQTVQHHTRLFIPETIPFYAATESFNSLRQANRHAYSEYAYKEAALNPTNPRDRAVEWESDVINTFRNNPHRHDLTNVRDTPTGKVLFVAHPIKADQSCMGCHDQARTAPASLVRRYGGDNGFGWKVGEVVGAQIVSVPMALPVQMADRAFRSIMLYLTAIFVIGLILLNVLLYFMIVRPASRLSQIADEVSRGNLQAPELNVTGKDEISILAASFNRMRVSLTQALKMLENQAE
jgi:protein-histidine pros-kinase